MSKNGKCEFRISSQNLNSKAKGKYEWTTSGFKLIQETHEGAPKIPSQCIFVDNLLENCLKSLQAYWRVYRMRLVLTALLKISLHHLIVQLLWKNLWGTLQLSVLSIIYMNEINN